MTKPIRVPIPIVSTEMQPILEAIIIGTVQNVVLQLIAGFRLPSKCFAKFLL